MKNQLLKLLLIFPVLLILSSCANYKLHQIDDTTAEMSSPDKKLTHSIFMIGNAGDGSENGNPTLDVLEAHLEKASKKSTVLFLGDQTGMNGMPSKSEEKKRKMAEKRLDAQLKILKNFKGQPVFIPGNTDWKKYGVKGVKRQEKYIENFLNKGMEDDDDDDWENDYFLPDGACPGPEVIEINDDLVIIVIDTQWWLMDWDEQPNVNEGCEVKSREAFELAILDEIKDHKKKNIVFATHHAMYSVGPHGGKFTAKQHLFPFTDVAEKAYVPLPVVGSLYLFLRKAGILQQDLSNRHYEDLEDVVVKPTQDLGEYIFASASEYSLQYNRKKGQHFINSGGGGSKKSATGKDPINVFSYGENGFSKIDFYKDGSAWLEFWAVNDENPNGKKVYSSLLKGPLPVVTEDDLPDSYPEYESKVDSVYASPSSRSITPLGPFATFMLGERRRALYLEKYNFPTLDLATFSGGLTVIKKGGGKQTNSLRFEDPEGKQFVIRSLTKDATRGVPYPFNQLPYVNFLFSETFLGSHSFAPLTLSPLADAAKVYHTNPGLYYVAKQPSLGIHNDMFGGEVYLLEERPSNGWIGAEFFGNAEDFESTPDVNEKTMKNNHKHKVDQRWLVRSRLFDMLIGDFDRHGDQWRWAETKQEDGTKLYQPIPRDRDNAYATYDGFAFKLLWPYHPIVRQLAVYGEKINNPKWSYYNARHFDHNFMNEMSLEDWKAEAKYIQDNISDELITKSLQLFPTKVANMTSAGIAKTMKYRRDNLQEIAAEFYTQLAKRSIVRGSDKKELFEITRVDDEHTDIKMYDSNSDGEKQELLYHRVFKTSETNDVYIYGLGDDDIFRITGNVKKGIRLYVVGGAGKDDFKDESKVGGLGKKDRFYDTKKGNKVDTGSEAKDKTSNIAKNNTYEVLGSQFDEGNLIGAPTVGFKAGDGPSVGVLLFYKVNKFNKYPVAQKHMLKFNYAFATNGIDLTYGNTFFEAAKSWDLVFNSEFRSDRYSFNYYGLGNDTPPDSDAIEDFRVLQSKVYFDLGFQRRFANETSTFSIRPLAQYRGLTDTNDKFIDRTDENGLTDEDYEKRWYGGVVSELNFRNTDNDIHPRDGFELNNKFSWQKNLNGSERNFRTFGSSFTLYKAFFERRLLVFATKIGTELVRGNYDFYFAPTLGQDENLRGFFGQRYRGETSFYHTTDLRMALGTVKNSFLPFSIGITGSFDYGRVWQPGEDSNKWHKSAGGGIWVVPLNIVIISATYNKILDGSGGRFAVSLGHAF